MCLIYGCNKEVDKKNLWSELISLYVVIGLEPWIMVGDFNVVRRQSERLDEGSFDHQTEFNMRLEDIDMEYLASKCFWFTWSNTREGMRNVKSIIEFNKCFNGQIWQILLQKAFVLHGLTREEVWKILRVELTKLWLILNGKINF